MKKIFILLAATVLTVGCSNGYDSVNAQEFSEAAEEARLQQKGSSGKDSK